MRLTVKSALLLLVAMMIATASFGTVVASAKHVQTRPCPVFTGPGDNVVHSKNFRVAHISCGTGKKVLEGCRTDGTKCVIAHSTWHCHGVIPGRERCTSGHKVATVFWLD